MTTARTANGRAAAQAAPPHEPQSQAALLDQVVEETRRVRYSVDEIATMARYVGRSGFGFNEAQAFTLMMLCEADGLHPIHALRRYHITEHGKVTMQAVAMLAEMRRLGWVVKLLTDPNEVTHQEFSFEHPTKPVVCGRMAFGENEAKAAGLNEKKNYKQYAPDMFRARAISRGCRLNEPGIVAGVYTPEEVAEFEPASQPPNSTFRGFQSYNASKPLDSEVGNATPQSEPATEPARGECSAWIQSQIDDTENEWMSICAKEKKPHKHLGEKAKRLNVWQVVNGVVTDWLERGLIEPEAVQGDKGLRDRTKVLDMIKHEWAAEGDGEGLMVDVLQYLRGKIDAAAEDAGINLDAEPAATEAT